MHRNLNYIKLVALLAIISGLYAFSSHRSASRNIDGITVEFVGDQNLYITQEAVNKLLIQKFGGFENVPKEKLVLNAMEKVLQTNEMVKNAQVYLTVDGKLESKIVQRRPIGRVESATKFYVDDEGKRMPLSLSHSARVPIITGEVTGESLEDVYEILKYINEDEFLRKNVIGIHIQAVDKYQLKFRVENFVVSLGSIDNLEEKFNNFKAFYAKADRDDTLEKYKVVSLEFNNQVVCTKI
ncbi:type VI secretion system baseplate subunit TssF [Aggregatimonas sangjinii]|uniref:Type VI secretion system baseplate subunit TssF n=1 Tax=Aggregatimonas sangjinii TaxID=2583587 RepID=A0A5B7SPY0_9FLAO|nr:cell division protein FtsQ/DivIB [Aggregatimonas sangjinii]QCW99052.1 type VI secretion system baseplate subunit TssF [Aggregatimonas sangjinii]